MLIFLTIPGLRDQDLPRLPNLTALFEQGSKAKLKHSFPAVTWPSQATMLTGKQPADHGVVANGFYWRDEQKVEMWTAWNEKIESPQIWDLLNEQDPPMKSAAWFPMLSKGCNADFVCMPAPIHKPDGSEDLWCYTKPQEFYGELLEELGHFPLMNFWGPLSSIKSTNWIVDSAVRAAKKFAPDFFYIYLPHLDYAAQKDGPNSEAAMSALDELNTTIGGLIEQLNSTANTTNMELDWIAASEYVITEVNHVTYPNRILREANLLTLLTDEAGRETIDFAQTPAWALVDHQFSHIFVADRNEEVIDQVAGLYRSIMEAGGMEADGGIAEVLVGQERAKYSMDHERSGDVIVISSPHSWQAYYWWLDDANAPEFANKVDIHRKPGYDPVELFFDPATKGVPLDASLVKGSHGAPAVDADQQGVLLVSREGFLDSEAIADTDVCDLAIRLVNR